MKASVIYETLKNLPIFSPLSEKELSELVSRSETGTYKCGEEILCDNRIAVILSGSAAVKKRVGEKFIIMRMMECGGISGVASLFSEDEEGVSYLEAARKTEVLFINKTEITDLIKTNGEFAESYIRFLTSRIRFLNLRIKSYTSGRTEAKLAFHLLMLDEDEDGNIDVGVSLIKLAEILDIGRASLYRAFDSLCDKGIISKQGHKITILDRKSLSEVANGSL